MTEGRPKVEDGHYTYSVDEANKTLDALGRGLFPWPILGLIFLSREVLDAFSATTRASLGFAQSNFVFAARRFLGSVWLLLRHCLEKLKVRPYQS